MPLDRDVEDSNTYQKSSRKIRQNSGVVPHSLCNNADYSKRSDKQGIYSDASSSNALNQNMVASRPKKRKDSTFLQSPRHKVYLQDSELYHSISVSEQEWAVATNTLCEKMDPTETICPSKKRLVLSTNLMQQLLRPAPTFVFSDINAAYNYEIMLYFESRITLADACSLTCHLDLNNSTNDDQERGYSSLVNAFMEKLQKLESDLQSLERTTSVLDIILEIQDTERFSMLNRLAKFHSRAKTLKRSGPQRYVELQKPGSLPELLQCLPL